MGKKYVSVATKRLPAAANRKNLAFPTKEEEETKLPNEAAADARARVSPAAVEMPLSQKEKASVNLKKSASLPRNDRLATNSKKTHS